MLLNALQEIHSAGVLHRDMAPRNVVRRPLGALCIIDFEAWSVGHRCPGPLRCEELASLGKALTVC
ncbi:hypothetical protein B0H14DRAFT_3002861 [Mycena olivaceomarginata]|nr:hypothetical protein B0H14DRAFT_3002861 [Mycena olivaceomarginata]